MPPARRKCVAGFPTEAQNRSWYVAGTKLCSSQDSIPSRTLVGMSAGESRLPTGWKPAQRQQPQAKFLHLSHLRRLKGCEQVAAVCYRIRGTEIEFLLVQTRGGRWTFPKGSAEPGLTHAQAAALEAFEEAGVHGRMEEAAFTRYVRRKGSVRNSSLRSGEKSVVVNAHLCEVRQLEPPQEADRNPTWFPPSKAKRHLREGRKADYASELVRVLDRAVARIQLVCALHSPAQVKKDALQRVQFTALDSAKAGVLRDGAKNRRNVVTIDQF